jgi:sugar lactone lactonase YvrE
VASGVATINASTGAIIPVASGTATVTATQAALSGKNMQAVTSYALTVIIIDPTPTLTFATPATLTCAVGCTNAATSSIPTGGAITYAISNQSVATGVATINATTGAITPVASGTATITATQAAVAGKNAQGTATYTLTIIGLSITSFTPEFGGVGYTVTITGTNFDGTNAANNVVTICGVQTATPTNISSTSLTVLVPRGATGPGSITVTVGSKSASKATFTEYATVTTFAGDGTQNWTDATGLKAQFYTPAGLAFDNSGNLIVADYGNSRVRSITIDGMVSTIGGGGSGNSDGQGTASVMHEPWGVAVHKTSGEIYVTERSGGLIRKISTSGYVSTYAGSTEGNADGTNKTNVQFDQPHGIAINPTFNHIYISDRWYSLIRQIVGNSYVITLAGNNLSNYVNGNGKSTGFYFPDGLALDASGDNLYIADYTNNCIRKLVVQGSNDVTTFAGASVANNGAGGFVDGTGTAARFSGPSGLAIDAAGNLYVADYGNGLIRKITPAGVVTTVAGRPNLPDSDHYKDGLGPFTSIYQPWGIAVDAIGDIYISEGTNRIRKIVQ